MEKWSTVPLSYNKHYNPIKVFSIFIVLSNYGKDADTIKIHISHQSYISKLD